MRHSWVVVLALASVAQAQPDLGPLVDVTFDLPPRDPTSGLVSLPPQPSFELPPPNADGTHGPREIRIRSARYLDQEITVRGYVTWAYDCATDIRQPGMTDKDVQKRIDEDPTLCERPKLYLGETAGTSGEHSLWVVELPRPYNKLEMTRLRPADRTDPNRCEPKEKNPAKQVCGPYKVGDQLEITGTWKLVSPHAERNSDGLLVYQRMKNLTQNWESPGPKPVMAKPPLMPRAVVETAVKPATMVKLQSRKSFVDAARPFYLDGLQALRNRQYDTAIAAFTKAAAELQMHHAALYWLAVANAHKGDWSAAAKAAESARFYQPGVAMYHLMLGRARYEETIQNAREDLARKTNQRPADVVPDWTSLNFEKALPSLRMAVAIDPTLWRAHYLIGSIHRYANRTVPAVTSLMRAVALGPQEAAPWVALVEQYRRWDYVDQSIAILTTATTVVRGAEVAQIYAQLGSVLGDKKLTDQAIDAYTKALDARPDLHLARFGRGQAHFARGEYAKAKLDLETYVRSATDSFFKSQASRMLLTIAAKTARP